MCPFEDLPSCFRTLKTKGSNGSHKASISTNPGIKTMQPQSYTAFLLKEDMALTYHAIKLTLFPPSLTEELFSNLKTHCIAHRFG